MLEFGSDSYHQPVLWIIHEFLVKLEDCGSVNLDLLIEIITRPVSSFIKVYIHMYILKYFVRLSMLNMGTSWTTLSA